MGCGCKKKNQTTTTQTVNEKSSSVVKEAVKKIVQKYQK